MDVDRINSILIADIGNVHTRLVLIDLVEGQYRMIASSRAHTTAEPPLGKVSLGLEHAAQTMGDLIGRELINEGGDSFLLTPENGGQGVDTFMATSSAGRPMRVVLVGLTPEMSLASGRRALAGTYVTITDTLTPDDERSEEDQINALLSGEPDLILIVGGTDGGADALLIELVEKVERALALIQRGTRPAVLFAGNKNLQRRVRDLLQQTNPNVFVARNVRPSLKEEQLFATQIELAMVYDEYRTRSPGGFAEITRFSQVGVVPTTQGYISTVRYLCQLPQHGVGPLCVDVGSANSVIVAGTHGDPHYTIRTDLGIGHTLPSALKAITPAAVKRWLSFDISDEALWDYAYNKQLFPATIPLTGEELMIEQAIAREIVRLLVAQARPEWDLGVGDLLPDFAPIIGAGAILTEAQHPGIAAMLLLDALQPTGSVELRLDPHNLISALGVVAYLKPVVTVQALDSGGLIALGTAFCPSGRIRQGRAAMVVQIRPAEGKQIRHVVKGGEIWMAPVLPGVSADVTIRLRRGLSLEGKGRIRRRVIAGAAGIIFDARGRPLVMPRPQDRTVRFTEWQMAMMGRERRHKVDEPLPLPSLDDEPLPGVDDLFPDSVEFPGVEEDAEHALFS